MVTQLVRWWTSGFSLLTFSRHSDAVLFTDRPHVFIRAGCHLHLRRATSVPNNVFFQRRISEFMDFSFRGWVEKKGRWLGREESKAIGNYPIEPRPGNWFSKRKSVNTGRINPSIVVHCEVSSIFNHFKKKRRQAWGSSSGKRNRKNYKRKHRQEDTSQL